MFATFDPLRQHTGIFMGSSDMSFFSKIKSAGGKIRSGSGNNNGQQPISADHTPKNGATTATATEGDPSKNEALQENGQPQRSAWDPRSWGKKIWIVVLVSLIVIIAAVLGGVLGSKAVRDSRYPDYSKLNYTLVDAFGGEYFFDNFYYHDGGDPAGGFVQYLDVNDSALANLTFATATTALLRASLEQQATTGRQSVRIVSKKTYNDGLFIFDVKQIPYGCGTWPALWLVNETNWPLHGEIDIIEGVNNGLAGLGKLDYIANHATLHTNGGCKMDVKRKETGHVVQTDCHNTTNYNAGCGVIAAEQNATYGEPWNAAGGGVYAMELRSAGIRVWSWLRDALPTDISSVLASNGTSTIVPDPSTWSEPLADFPNTNCDMEKHFVNQSIIANIDFCGGWAADEFYYTTLGKCPWTCEQYVANGDFSTAVWEWGGWWVYQAPGAFASRDS